MTRSLSGGGKRRKASHVEEKKKNIVIGAESQKSRMHSRDG